jgi:hypothetical protein
MNETINLLTFVFSVMHSSVKPIEKRIKCDCIKKTQQVMGYFALSHKRRRGIIECINKIISTIFVGKPMTNPNDSRGLQSFHIKGLSQLRISKLSVN